MVSLEHLVTGLGPGDPDETDRMILGISSSEVTEAAFRDWIAQRCR